jgi:hypothetical protein
MSMIELLTADQLARQLNRSLRTLHRWRTETGTGPTGLKIAGRWYYRRGETEQFILAAWVAGVSRWPGLHDDPPECDAVQQHDEHVPPVLSAEVITRPRGPARPGPGNDPDSMAAVRAREAGERAALDDYALVNAAEAGPRMFQ